MAILDYTILDI